MRKLKYTLELPDGSHHEHAPVGYGEAEGLLKTMDWKAVRDVSLGPAPGENADNPFLLFMDDNESFFMVLPVDQGFQVTCRVADKWNLMGFMSKQKSFTLEFGILNQEDALALLKLFFEDNYPALRALEREMGWDDQGRA
jgi:hypothetical protein